MAQKIFIEPAFTDYYRNFPLVLVDIGAQGHMQENWHPARKYLRLIGFEPNPREFNALKQKFTEDRYLYLNTALYKEKTIADFYITKGKGSSSLIRPNQKFLNLFSHSERTEVVKTQKISVDTLDNQLRQNGVKDIDFIKLDTQGSELFILQGATEALNNSALGIETEIEFSPIYQDQPLFSEVDPFIRKCGFQLFDLRPCYWKRKIGEKYGHAKGQLVFGDALYLREGAHISRIIKESASKDAQKAKALKTLSICFLYGYFDYALEILEIVSSLFDKEELKLLERAIKNRPFSSRIPYFRGKARLGSPFYRLYRFFHTAYQGKILRGRNIGNLE